MNQWTPITDKRLLRRFGKLLEELGECTEAAARCIIQGPEEIDPKTLRKNIDRLADEMADVHAQIVCTIEALNLNQRAMHARVTEKVERMDEWEKLCND